MDKTSCLCFCYGHEVLLKFSNASNHAVCLNFKKTLFFFKSVILIDLRRRIDYKCITTIPVEFIYINHLKISKFHLKHCL